MASYYILKPLREAYLLSTQSIEQVAKIHVVTAVATLATVQVYAWLVRRFSGRQLAVWIYGSFVLCVTGLWSALASGVGVSYPGEFAWVFYIWVSIFSVFAVTLFWSLTHDIFTPDEGSRYYGFIGAAGILGGLAGGGLTSLLVGRVGLTNLLLVSAALLVPCVTIAAILGARAPSTRTAKSEKPASEIRALDVFRSSRYLCGIFAFVFLYQAVSVLVDNQTKLVLKQHYSSKEDLAQFSANLYVATNLIGFLANVFVTGWLQTRFGPLPGLLVLPLCALFGALGFYTMPSIQVAAVVTTLGLAASYSVQQSSKELLYLPVPTNERYVAKAFIDTFGFRLGNGLTSVWLWIAVPMLGSPQACGLIFLAAAGMIACAGWLAPRHREMLATSPAPLP